MSKQEINDKMDDFSQILDVMQTIAGSDEYIKSFPSIIYKRDMPTASEKLSAIADRAHNYVYFHPTRKGAYSGHFHFIDRTSNPAKLTDSYHEGWQNNGSNGFCQTFAVMGALGLGSIFLNKSKMDCSILAFRFILQNAKTWKKWSSQWKKTCRIYPNIKNLNIQEIEEDLEFALDHRFFWKSILDEFVSV